MRDDLRLINLVFTQAIALDARLEYTRADLLSWQFRRVFVTQLLLSTGER